MKKTIRLFWLMALPMLLGLVSCSIERDNPVDPNPLAAQVSGLWWSLTEQEGTYSDAADSYPYTRMGQAICFNDDGTGYGVTFFFNNDQGDPIAIIGGEWMAPFTYTSTADGRLNLNFDKAYKEYADYFKKWTMTYGNETVTATNGTLTLTLEKPSDTMALLIHDWDEQFNGGAMLDDAVFNPNDVDFNSQTWREQQAIYLYDGLGEHVKQYGGVSYKFSLVPLPWYSGTKQSNLPNGFCDDITPANGWMLVMNECGKTGGIRNNNFFAVYNKYLGILRFFYYMPADAVAGNDHVWEVSMTDNLGSHSLFGYGVPSDRTVSRAAVGQTASDYIAPWVASMSQDGLVTPNVGWWAFDVDLSTYRPNSDVSDDMIRLQMRSWNSGHTTLFSAMAANIDGTIKAGLKLEQQTTKKSTSTAQGIIMGLQAAAQVSSAYASFYSGNWAASLTSVGQLCGTGASLAGLAGSGSGGSTSYKLDGTISLGLTGDIDTKGVISTSAVNIDVASPTLYLKDFYREGNQVGEGVWNLKTAPVVYVADIYGWEKVMRGYNNWTQFCNRPYFFDPNSVEVELNPNIFPEDQIEWMEVDGLCIATADKQYKPSDNYTVTGNTALRDAYGVSTLNPLTYYSVLVSAKEDKSQEGCLWDFLYNQNDKQGLEALHTVFYDPSEYNKDGVKWHNKIQGRGKNGFAIEPQAWGSCLNKGWPEYNFLPFLEVNVKVKVKMKGMEHPIVLSRNYLPDIKDYGNGNDFARNTQRTRPYASKMKGHSELYDYQMQRIKDICTRYGYPYPDAFSSDAVHLDKLTGDYTAQDGDVLTGTLGSNVIISIADGATVMLRNVTINGQDNYKCRWAGITCPGNATIVLEGTNSVKGFYNAHPGIYIAEGKTLTIRGNGSLTASSNGHGAGIGGGNHNISCGNIIIEGGTINAVGGEWAAGIGGGYESSCGNITIKGGTITATGGEFGASIGGGGEASCGDITINGGTVTATSEKFGAGIGGSGYGTCGNITINGGTVTATCGTCAAGIGAGYGFKATCGTVTINGGIINATCGKFASGIGSGEYSTCSNITINGGTVTATGGMWASGIGGGEESSCGDITIAKTVTSVTATKGEDAPYSIGAGRDATCGTVTIGGKVYPNGISESPYTYKP